MSHERNSKLREFYEALPFPSRDAAAERSTALPVSRTDILGKLNHHGFGGRRDFTRGFRVLVAGGGTGDAAIFLAAQLRGTKAEVACLDLSEASLGIARQRAAAHGLAGEIEWVRASLLDLPRLGLGRFDYVSCLGVLHHLEAPEEGLHALTHALADEGALALMVYGRYGRLDVYAVQELMRRIGGGDDLPRQLHACRAALRALSPAHPLLRGRSADRLERLIADPANLADTFLHPQDRAYTVPELHAFVESAGLSIVNFTNFVDCGRLEYDPDTYVEDPALRRQLAGRPPRERQAIAELLHGHMFVHAFYAARPGRNAASFQDGEMVPSFLNVAAAEAVQRLRREGNAAIRLSSGIVRRLTPSRATLLCLALVDGRQPLGEIWRTAATLFQRDAASVAADTARDFEALNALNWLCLSHQQCPPPPALAYRYRRDAVPLLDVA